MRATTRLGFASCVITGALGALIGSFATGCSSDDGCASARDCASGMMCENRVCVPGSGGMIPIYEDARPHPDALPTDTGQTDGTMLDGEVVDGGMSMPGDGGGLDATDGMVITNPDGGPPVNADAATLPASGFATYVEVTTAAPEVTSYADFFDYTTATYNVSEQIFGGPDATTCRVTTRRLTTGAPTAIGLTSVVFASENGGLTRTLVPDASKPGHFIPMGTFTTGLFAAAGGQTNVDTHSSGAPGSVGDSSTGMASPRAWFLASSPPMGTQVALMSGVSFMWSGTSAGVAVAELYDADREVVMKCGPFLDDGNYVVPMGAIQAWYNESPTAPATLELRYEESRTVMLPIEGGGMMPATYILARGARWAAF